MSIRIHQFRPLALHLENVGPFSGRLFSFPIQDANKDPANLYLILGVNGLGKTTVLESMAYLLSLLACEPESAIEPDWLTDHPNARLQLDLLLQVQAGGVTRNGILSLVVSRESGRSDPELSFWLEGDLKKYDARWWVRDGYVMPLGVRDRHLIASRPLNEASFSDVREIVQDIEALDLMAAVREHLHQAHRRPASTTLGEPIEDAPSVLYFTAHRDLSRRVHEEVRTLKRPPEWGHHLVQRFDSEQGTWSSSLDHLLVWLDYLDGEFANRPGPRRFDKARDLINRHVFRELSEGPSKRLSHIDRERMEAVVEVRTSDGSGRTTVTGTHRIDRLSGGERSLAQIFLRIAAHMSANTVILLDEADLHLHPRWERDLMWELKSLVRDNPGMTIILTTHSIDMLKVFDTRRAEEGIRKGGYILDSKDFSDPPVDG